MKHLAIAAALAVAASFCGTASAAGPTPFPSSSSPDMYVQGNIGQSRVDTGCDDGTACDNTSTGFKILAGKQLTRHVAVEVSHTEFGTARATQPKRYYSLDYTVKSSSTGLGLAYSHDLLPRLQGIARGGVAYNRTSATGTVVALSPRVPPGTTTSVSESHVAPYAGIGLAYKINRNFSVGADVDVTLFEVEGRKTRGSQVSGFARYSF